MAQAKITISREQAQKLGLLTIHTKTKSFMLYDPKSGITLRETKEGEEILVPEGADTSNLERFALLDYCTLGVVDMEVTLPEMPTFETFSFKAASNEDKIYTDVEGTIDNDLMTIDIVIPLASQGISFDVQSLVADWTLSETDQDVTITALDIDGETEALTSGGLVEVDYSDAVQFNIQFTEDKIDPTIRVYGVTVTVAAE